MEQSDSSDAEKKKVDPEVDVTGSGDAGGNPSEEVEPTGAPTADEIKANTEPEGSSVLSTTEPSPTVETQESVSDGDTANKISEAPQSTKLEIVSIEGPRDEFITTETKSPQEEIVVDNLAEKVIASCTAELKQDRLDTININEDVSSQLEVDSHTTVNDEIETKKDNDEKPSEMTEKCVSSEVAAVEDNVVKSEVVDAKVVVQDSNPEANDSEECTPHKNDFTSTDMNETKSAVASPPVEINDGELILEGSAEQDAISSIALPVAGNVEIVNSSSDLLTEALDLHMGKTSDPERDGDRVVTPQPMEVDEVILEYATGDTTPTTEEPMETEEVVDSEVAGNNKVVSDAIRSACAPVVPLETVELGRCSASPERPTHDTVTASDAKEGDMADCKVELDSVPAESADVVPETETECPHPEDNANTEQPSTSLPDSASSTCSVLMDNKPCSPSSPLGIPEDLLLAVPDDPPLAVPADLSMAVPADLSTAVPADLSKAVSADPTPAVPEDLTPAVPEDPTPAVPEDLTPAVPEDPTPAVPADLSTAVPADLSLAVPEDPPQDPPIAVPEDLTPAVPADLSMAVPEDPPQDPAPAVPEDLTLAVPEDPTPAVPEDLSLAVPEDPTPAVPEDPTPAVPEDLTPAVPEDLTPAVPEDPTPAVPEDPTPAVPEDPTPAVPEDPTPAVPEDLTPAVPEDLAPAVPEDLSLAVPEDPPQDPPMAVPEDLTVTPAVPADLSTTVPADLSTAVPEDLSTALPEDLSTTVPAELSTAVPADLSKADDPPPAVPHDPQPAVPDLDATLICELEELNQTLTDESPSIQDVKSSAAVSAAPRSSLKSDSEQHQYNTSHDSFVPMVTGSSETVPVEDGLNAGQQDPCPLAGTTAE